MQTTREPAREGHKGRGSTGTSHSTAAPAALHPLLTLQQQAGNQAVQELLRSGVIHPKLAISQPDDPDEREADRVAGQVMRAHAGFPISSPCSCAAGGETCEECQQKPNAAIQRRASSNGGRVHGPDTGGNTAAISSLLRRESGQPLDAATRAFFEPRFGHDFSDVRVHTGSVAAQSARSISAHAYTLGSNVVFAPGKYNPETNDGRLLLAHELTHTIQQKSHHGAAPEILQRDDDASPPTPAVDAGGGTTPPVTAAPASAAELDQQYQAALASARQTGNWQDAAEKLNGFNYVDIEARLAQLSQQEVGYIHQGAVDNPKVGPDSQVAKMTASGVPPASIQEPLSSQVSNLDEEYRRALGAGDYQTAAEKLNGFNKDDILSRLAQVPDQVANLHQGAIDNPRVGPDSQVAQLTAPALNTESDSSCFDKSVPEMSKTEKLSCAVEYARQARDAAFARQLEALTSRQAIFAMVALAALYIGAQFTPVGWVADAFALAALTITYFFIGATVGQALADVGKFINAINATTQDELKESGEALADAVALGGITLIMSLITHAGRDVPPGRTPFTPPDAEGSRVGVTPDGQLVRVPPDTTQSGPSQMSGQEPGKTGPSQTAQEQTPAEPVANVPPRLPIRPEDVTDGPHGPDRPLQDVVSRMWKIDPGTGKPTPQGRWLSKSGAEASVSDLDTDKMDPGKAYSVPIPEGAGEVVRPTGEYPPTSTPKSELYHEDPADRALVVRIGNYIHTFPIGPEHPAYNVPAPTKASPTK